jgi:GNAT superfamily N-acetyltransferase
MVSINSAIQVDLTGQVCADSMGPKFFSGIGGQVDFIRGAAMSPGGKPIIALPSTAKSGTVSRIVPTLDSGAGVVTSRGDVHYVVTEYGVAYLHGKSIRARAMALIEIAHPDFRADLRAHAVDRHLVPVAWEPPSEADRYPDDMEGRHDFLGKTLLVRPLRTSDADRLMEFFYSHSPETIYGRFRFPKQSLPREEAIRLCTIDYRNRFALAVFGQSGHDEHIVAVGRYRMNQTTRFAEPLIVVHEKYRRFGIGQYLLQKLYEFAERNGVMGFEHEFNPKNDASVHFFKSIGFPLTYDEESGVYRFSIRFDSPDMKNIVGERRVPRFSVEPTLNPNVSAFSRTDVTISGCPQRKRSQVVGSSSTLDCSRRRCGSRIT